MPHVVWDWNGTLFDDLPIVVDAVNVCLRSRGGSEIDAEGYRSHFVRPLTRFYEVLLDTTIDDEALRELDDIFQAAYWDRFDSVDLHPEARSAIDRLDREGATQSIASMLWHDMLVPTVRGFGLDERMLALDGNRGAVGDTKEQHLIHHVARLRELHPHLNGARMTVVGDILDDADAATAAGIDCILYDGGSQPRATLEENGAPVVDSLIEAVDIVLGDTERLAEQSEQ